MKTMLNKVLFCPSSASLLLYKLEGCNDERMAEFNEIIGGGQGCWADGRDYLLEKGIGLHFSGVQSPVFSNNLLLVRDDMEKIIGWCVKNTCFSASGKSGVKETVERMIGDNPFQVLNPSIYYEKAMKDFLIAVFVGMRADRAWDGKEQVNGAYVMKVNEDEPICYPSIQREAFRDFLYENTLLEYVENEGWGYILKSDGAYFLSLNVAIKLLYSASKRNRRRYF